MNIIITGASSGIGYQTALKFASQKDNSVFSLARSGDKLQLLASEKTAGKIIPVKIDLSSYQFNDLDSVLTANHTDHIDILIHNAGQLINKPFEQITGNEWEELYKANVIGVAMLTRHLLSRMGVTKHTHIVMIGSIGGVNGTLKFPGLSAYSSSKGALTTLSECLAEEFKGRNINVNCLALGSVQTEMLKKAFPEYTTLMTPESMSDYIYDFSKEGWRHFNGKTLQVSVTNP